MRAKAPKIALLGFSKGANLGRRHSLRAGPSRVD
jgi:hypothetical protein